MYNCLIVKLPADRPELMLERAVRTMGCEFHTGEMVSITIGNVLKFSRERNGLTLAMERQADSSVRWLMSLQYDDHDSRASLLALQIYLAVLDLSLIQEERDRRVSGAGPSKRSAMIDTSESIQVVIRILLDVLIRIGEDQ
jgi:hypothetical protein